ncbi:sucrase ferredoxin [Rhodococcus pyridinivorans]|uniref:sucrase ferredoxin n=1 Tax=Rhodococcus pyridinivorans TaxID=103816 RepID=UPI0020C72748|nr:sucrase ferredoxin [Rhodococcus pyridinivorans]UTM35281.1 sucrase ferredoxin [Rhodococcus pyridinivorans]
MAGTAPRGFVWILVEYRGRWPVNGFEGLDLDAAAKTAVFSAAQAARARILLVKRPGRRRRGGHDQWAVLRRETSGTVRQQWGTWDREEDLTQIVTALETPGDPGGPSVLLVCAHGHHDPCCAVRGRPVARALAERWPDQVWECSHVGGDRFAANVVVVPDGVYYGSLDAESSVLTIEEHFFDRIHHHHLRGYTDMSPPQQAALAATLRRFGPAGRSDYVIAESVREGDRWRVRLAGRAPHPERVDVELQAHRTPPCRLTCRGAPTGSVMLYEPTSVRAV